MHSKQFQVTTLFVKVVKILSVESFDSKHDSQFASRFPIGRIIQSLRLAEPIQLPLQRTLVIGTLPSSSIWLVKTTFLSRELFYTVLREGTKKIVHLHNQSLKVRV